MHPRNSRTTRRPAHSLPTIDPSKRMDVEMATSKPMQLGMVGLGRMGSNLVRRLANDGHNCVVYDVNAQAVTSLSGDRVTGASSLPGPASQLQTPRAIWAIPPPAI